MAASITNNPQTPSQSMAASITINPQTLSQSMAASTTTNPQIPSRVMATSITIPCHVVFAFLISETRAIVQMHFPSSSPFNEHPASMWIFIIGLFFYCFASGYHIKHQIYTPTDTTFLNRCLKVILISGGLIYIALISVLIPHSLQPLVFIIWLILLLIYFNHKKIAEKGENIASYLYDLWRRTKRRASNLYDQWRRT